jgi:hypothetical protein
MKNFFTSTPSPSDTFEAKIEALASGESVYLEGVDKYRYMELYEKYKKERNDGKLRFVRDSRPTELDVFNTEKPEPKPEPKVEPRVEPKVEPKVEDSTDWRGVDDLDTPAFDGESDT